MNPDDILLWPNGDWCMRREYTNGEYGTDKSDDFETVDYDSERWQELIDESL